MSRIVLIISLLTVSFFAKSQSYQAINENGEGIGFITIYDIETQNGVVSDENGLFEYKSGSSVIISSVGYVKDTILLVTNNAERPLQITLTKDVVTLNEVVVRNNQLEYNDTFKSGHHDANFDHNLFYTVGGGTVLVKIENPSKVPALLKKGIFRIKCNDKSFLRIRVLSINKFGSPGEDLLLENVIIKDGNFLGNLTVDLEKYGVIVPPEGIFIGFDMFLTDKDEAKFKIGIGAVPKRDSYMSSSFGKQNKEATSPDKLRLFKTANNGRLVGNYMFGIKAAYPEDL